MIIWIFSQSLNGFVTKNFDDFQNKDFYELIKQNIKYKFRKNEEPIKNSQNNLAENSSNNLPQDVDITNLLKMKRLSDEDEDEDVIVGFSTNFSIFLLNLIFSGFFHPISKQRSR